MSKFVNFDEQLIEDAIFFLTNVESGKEWIKNETVGDYMFTCGYTAPGITIVILFFQSLGNDYRSIIHSLSHEEIIQIKNGINEAIGNLLDLAPICLLSGCEYGIRGLINSTPDVGAPIQWYTKSDISLKDNLLPGPNLISFTSREIYNDSFHHSVIYVPYSNPTEICYIIDSWYQDHYTCRPISYRKFNLEEIVTVLNRLNDIGATHSFSESGSIIHLLQYYFLAPKTSPVYDTIKNKHKISVHLINREVINTIVKLSFDHVKHNPSSFGGKYKKHRKIYSKRKKSNNKSKKRKRNVKSVINRVKNIITS